MLGHEPLAAPLQGDQVVRAVEVSERQIGREPLLGRHQAVLRLRLHTATLQQQLHRYPLERVVEPAPPRSEEHTSELQSPCNLVCRLLLEKKKNKKITYR